MRDDYWEESVRPLTSLCFVAPLLVLYEVGVASLDADGLRNGADVWLRQMLGTLGFGRYFFLPCVTCGLLLGWHHVTRHRWRLNPSVLSGMVCESVGLGICLVIFAFVFSDLVHDSPSEGRHAVAVGTNGYSHLLSYLGAGIYEELLFRLLLFSAVAGICRHCGVDSASSVLFATISTSLLFAAAHYQLFMGVGDEFTWESFFFRLGAGSFFSLLFLCRGFGIAVGTHAIYDILIATVS